MRIDAHQHFWTYDPERYGWIGAGMEILAQDYGPEQLLPLLAAAGLDASIAVQARHDLEETDELLAMAAAHEHVAAVVGWVDLAHERVADQLDARLGPHLAGIRHILQDEPDDEHMLRPAFQRGITALTERRLAYDLLLHPRHLPIALRLVDAHPEQTFVLDHLAKPFIERGELEPWRSDLARLAERPHVSLKLSGLVTEASWTSWTPADLDPFLDAALEAFGPTRLLFGSDWPVCLLAADYPTVAATAEGWAERLSATEQAALWGGNAARVYGLDRPA